jgi:hypothetical protein
VVNGGRKTCPNGDFYSGTIRAKGRCPIDELPLRKNQSGKGVPEWFFQRGGQSGEIGQRTPGFERFSVAFGGVDWDAVGDSSPRSHACGDIGLVAVKAGKQMRLGVVDQAGLSRLIDCFSELK